MGDVDPAQFRQLLGRFATGVAVVTANRPDGRPAGMTANSLSSVSLRPPLISVCIEKTAEMHGILLAADDFVLNVLASDQEMISRRFAGDHDDRFDGIGYQVNHRGLVVLDGVIAHIECERIATHDAGDHTIFLGRVTGGQVTQGQPLLYYRGGYTGLSHP